MPPEEKRLALALAQPVRALVDPIDGVAVAVQNGRFALPLVASIAAGVLATISYFLRWDSASSVIGDLLASNQLQRATESEIAEQILTASRVALVAGMAKAVFLTPLLMLALALVLMVTAWLFDRSAPFSRHFSAAAMAFLPLALGNLALCAVTLSQAAVSSMQMATIVPSNVTLLFPNLPFAAAQVLGLADFFRLWSAALLGLGFSAATGMPRLRGVWVGLGLYAMYWGIFVIGVPVMMSGGMG